MNTKQAPAPLPSPLPKPAPDCAEVTASTATPGCNAAARLAARSADWHPAIIDFAWLLQSILGPVLITQQRSTSDTIPAGQGC
jgi:hypothetical protein